MTDFTNQRRLVRMRRLLAVILAVIAVGVVASVTYYKDAAKHPTYKYTNAGGDTLTVGVAYSPMSLYRHGDTLGGFNYELMRELSEAYRFPVKFYPVASVDEALSCLDRGKFDVVMADIPAFASQKESYRFTVPVYTDRQVLVTRDSTISSPLMLAGKEVWVAAGSPARQRLENLSREIGDTIIVTTYPGASAEQLVILTAKGEIPRAVVNQEVARSLSHTYPDIRISDNISFSQFQSWILNRDSVALQDTLDARIERFKETPAYTALVSKWLTSDTPTPTDTLTEE
ncbi:MAG: transporter substrate-binding domain-containing protein [Duncaniella sp.]|nr:transporter substrate-binding domain-containing protein [Duncaniella sp.]